MNLVRIIAVCFVLIISNVVHGQKSGPGKSGPSVVSNDTALANPNSNLTCSNLTNVSILSDEDTIVLHEDCVLDLNDDYISIDGMTLFIWGNGHSLTFSTNGSYIFYIRNDGLLSIINTTIMAPSSSDTATSMTAMFRVREAALSLEHVDFNDSTSTTLSTEYLIYSPKADSGSIVTLDHVTFADDYPLSASAIFMIGTRDDDNCDDSDPCCESGVTIADTHYGAIDSVCYICCHL